VGPRGRHALRPGVERQPHGARGDRVRAPERRDPPADRRPAQPRRRARKDRGTGQERLRRRPSRHRDRRCRRAAGCAGPAAPARLRRRLSAAPPVVDRRHDLGLLLRSRTPVVAIETRDELRLLALLRDIGRARPPAEQVPLFRWSVTDGLQRLDVDLPPQPHAAAPAEVLKHVRAITRPGIYVLLDFHPYLDDPVNVRLMKDICLRFADVPRHLVLVSHRIDIPPELRPYAARFEMALPSDAERAAIVKRVAAEWAAANRGSPVRADDKAHDLLIRNLAGLSDADTERLARGAIFDDGAITRSDLPGVMQAKYELLNTG